MDGLVLLQKGKQCLTLARDIYAGILSGKLVPDSVMSELHSYGTELEANAERNAESAERNAKECKSMMEQLQLEESNISLQEQELNRQLDTTKAQLCNQQAKFDVMRNRLTGAEEELQCAERKLKEAQTIANASGVTASVVGALLFGLIGAVAGNVLGGSIAALVLDTEHARHKLQQCSEECRREETEVMAIDFKIHSLQCKIDAISRETAWKKQQCANFHRKATEMKEITVFYQKLAYMASMFKLVCEKGVNRIALLQRLIAISEERQVEYAFVQSRGALSVTMSLLEVWEAIDNYHTPDFLAHSLFPSAENNEL